MKLFQTFPVLQRKPFASFDLGQILIALILHLAKKATQCSSKRSHSALSRPSCCSTCLQGMCGLESRCEEGLRGAAAYSAQELGGRASRAGSQAGCVGREEVSSLLERSEEGSTCCTTVSCPSLHADVKRRPEAAPGRSRELAVFVQSASDLLTSCAKGRSSLFKST